VTTYSQQPEPDPDFGMTVLTSYEIQVYGRVYMYMASTYVFSWAALFITKWLIFLMQKLVDGGIGKTITDHVVCS